MEEIVIVDAKRTPLGSFGGMLSQYTAPELGATVFVELLKNSGIKPSDVDEVIMGNVLSAGIGQAPARQAALKAGLSKLTPSTTVNKVCASGMKSIMYAANQIMAGEADVIMAGGMESMSNVPYYLAKQRFGAKLGHETVEDGIIKDGLWDIYNDFHMGNAAELCAEKCNISREEQDEFAKTSYQRAIRASDESLLDDEIIPMKVKDRKGNTEKIARDEEIDRVEFAKFDKLKPVFDSSGTVTPANSSSINDGAAGVIVMSRTKAEELGFKSYTRIVSQSSAAKNPEWFTTAPADAIPKALERADLNKDDIELFEINEAFSVVSLINNRLLELDPEKVNIYGGAVSIGHPIGCSGARIITTLINAMQNRGTRYGCAGICNGGGGASAMVLERL